MRSNARDGHLRVQTVGVSIVLLVLSSATGFAQAQAGAALAQLELEDLMKIEVRSVLGASKFLEKVTDAPAAVSIVTAHEIEIYGYETLGDILRSSPGFNVTYDRNYSYVGVRGFQRPGDYNSRVLVVVDGHRINDPIYDMAYLGTEFPVDVELIDRVELIRGPSSSIYGTNAFLAVINVVTKKGAAVGGASVSAEGGSLRTGKARGVLGMSLANGLDLLVSGSRRRSGGRKTLYYPEFDTSGTEDGIAHDLDSDADSNLFASLSFKGLTFQGVYGSRDKQVPTASFDSWFNDPRLTTNDSQGWADVRYAADLSGNWKVTARGYYDRAAYNGRYPLDFSETSEPLIAVWADYAHSQGAGAEVDVKKVAGRHTVTAGAEYRNKFSLRQGAFDPISGAVYLDDRRHSRDSAAFVEDQFTVSTKLLLNAGVRLDHYEGFGATTNPRLALIVKPVEKTAIKLLWGTAFRAPNAYERYYSSDLLQPNPDLEPETVRTSEVVVERYFAEHYRVMANVYASKVRGLINHVATPEGTLVFVNLDAATTRGFEAEFEGKWTTGIGSRISYSFQHASDLETKIALVNSARQLATVNITLPLLNRRALAGIDVHHVGRVATLDGNFTNSFIVTNLTLTTREIGRGLKLSAHVSNLFDSDYAYPAGDEHRQNLIAQNGRTFRVGATYTWKRQ